MEIHWWKLVIVLRRHYWKNKPFRVLGARSTPFKAFMDRKQGYGNTKKNLEQQNESFNRQEALGLHRNYCSRLLTPKTLIKGSPSPAITPENTLKLPFHSVS